MSVEYKTMIVKKRSGKDEPVSFDKIMYRLQKLANDENLGQLKNVDVSLLSQEVIKKIFNGISTFEIDELSSNIAVSMATIHTDYSILASRILISNLHKSTTECFSECMEILYKNKDENNEKSPLVTKSFIDIVRKHKDSLNFCIKYNRDYQYDYFGYKTLERSYLLKTYIGNGIFKQVERPQHLLMRVSIQLNGDNLNDIINSYNIMSNMYYTHASPTLFNAGSEKPQMSSCLHGDTKVITTNRGPIPIKSIAIGDEVITHLGNIKRVSQFHVNPINDRDMYELQVYNSEPIKITGNHPVWSIKEGQTIPDWVPTEDISVGDYIAIPHICKLRETKETPRIDLFDYLANFNNKQTFYDENTIFIVERGLVYNIKRYLEFNADTCKLLAIFYSCGNIIANKYITFDVSTTVNIDIYNNIIKNNILINHSPSGNLKINCSFIAYIFNKLFTNNNLTKKLHKCFWNLNLDQFKSFSESFKETCFSISYLDLALKKDLYYLYRSFGVDFECFNRQIDYPIIIDGQAFMRLKYKTKIFAPQYVYNIGVDDDNSYCAEGLIVKNCFLLSMEDSMKGIYKTLGDCAMISKHAGGIGLSVSDIRAKGSYIKGTNGKSDGLVKMLKVFNETARYANQGSKRNGSFAMYLETWSSDIEDFLDLKKNNGSETERARDLFYALWVNDTFMKCVEEDKNWYLMSSDTCVGLTDVYGENFDKLYYQYISEGKYKKVIKARDLWEKILISQIETGMPYMTYKDAFNEKSNQKHSGVIKSSNLCSEIGLIANKNEIAVCNICTFSLVKFLDKQTKKFDHAKLYDVVKLATRNMNTVIDKNFYIVKETKTSNLKRRPIALGIQGLANLFFELEIPFDSQQASTLNKEIMETIYFAGLTSSMELAKELGKTYETFAGSPLSQGLFQFNLWGVKDTELSGRWDWGELRKKITQHGVMNSTITALPPTASTSQILGNYESFEPQTSNILMRSTLSGDFPVVNKYLVNSLTREGIWSEDIKNQILLNNGSIQNIQEIPQRLKDVFKTVWEISQKTLIDYSRDRGLFVDQSQSLNIFIAKPTIAKLSSMHFYGWKQGLKTGMYYLRSKPMVNSEKFTVQATPQPVIQETPLVCSLDNNSGCMSCSG